ncbi:MAG TPA: hypothetical protein VMD53_06880 [Rhizomicrobium sp.]|nr:hypothetical protein [Rhizomicrobium sp.]
MSKKPRRAQRESVTKYFDAVESDVDVFASWLKPDEARTHVKNNVRDDVQVENVFVEYLKGGIIRSSASRATSIGELGQSSEDGSMEIPRAYWEGLQSNDFWTTGVTFFDMRDPHTFGPSSARTRCFGIRFDPVGVQELIDNLPQREMRKVASTLESGSPKAPKPSEPEAAPSTPAVTEIAEPEPKGPPVSDAALKAWFSAYQTAYKETEQTEAHAVRSAKGMFADKSVARDRVRALLGTRKRGPKPKSDGR